MMDAVHATHRAFMSNVGLTWPGGESRATDQGPTALENLPASVAAEIKAVDRTLRSIRTSQPIAQWRLENGAFELPGDFEEGRQ